MDNLTYYGCRVYITDPSTYCPLHFHIVPGITFKTFLNLFSSTPRKTSHVPAQDFNKQVNRVFALVRSLWSVGRYPLNCRPSGKFPASSQISRLASSRGQPTRLPMPPRKSTAFLLCTHPPIFVLSPLCSCSLHPVA